MSDTPTRTTERRSTTESSTAEAAAADSANVKEDVCPECSGSLRRDEQRGERLCEDCGLVVSEDEIDHGPEWRAFDSKEKNQKSRVGSPTTNLQHDKGLSTNISWQDKDAYGQSLSSNQRAKMQRLRKWNERFRTQNSKQRAQKHANGEIQRMASGLGIPTDAQETAAMLYERATDAETVIGRSIEGVATACLYGAARMHGTPRPLDQVANVSRVERRAIARCFTQLKNDLSLSFKPVNPKEYVPQMTSDMEPSFPPEGEQLARELSEAAFNSREVSGKKPTVVAGAAIYAAGLITGEKVTQRAIADAGDVTTVSIRNVYQEIIEMYNDEDNGVDIEVNDARSVNSGSGNSRSSSSSTRKRSSSSSRSSSSTRSSRSRDRDRDRDQMGSGTSSASSTDDTSDVGESWATPPESSSDSEEQEEEDDDEEDVEADEEAESDTPASSVEESVDEESVTEEADDEPLTDDTDSDSDTDPEADEDIDTDEESDTEEVSDTEADSDSDSDAELEETGDVASDEEDDEESDSASDDESDVGELECPECDRDDFESEHGRNVHIGHAHGKEHIPGGHSHEDDRPVDFDHELACPECGIYDFKNKRGRNIHIARSHSTDAVPEDTDDERPVDFDHELACPECGVYDFENERGRNIHIARSHGSEHVPESEDDERPVDFDHELACPECGVYDFKNKAGRNIHIARSHGSEHVPDDDESEAAVSTEPDGRVEDRTEALELLSETAVPTGSETDALAAALLHSYVSSVDQRRDPAVIAASALYAASTLTDDSVTQSALADAFDVSSGSVSLYYESVLDVAGESEVLGALTE